MTPFGWLFLGFLCAMFAAFCLGYAVGRMEARGEWWAKRRELIGLLFGPRADPW